MNKEGEKKPLSSLQRQKIANTRMRDSDYRYTEIKAKANMQDLDPNDDPNNVSWMRYVVIPEDAEWKSYFDMIMLVCACENTIFQAYYSAFGLPDTPAENIIDAAVEGLFLLDLIFCFCQQYRDGEKQTNVSDLKMIAIHYLKGNFIFDAIAIIPFDMFLTGSKIRLYRLLKMLRVPRMVELIDVDRVKALVNNYVNKRLKRAVA